MDSMGGDTTERINLLRSKISTYSPEDRIPFCYTLGPEMLLWAASCGHIGIIKLLLDNGIDINSKDKQGRTSLHLAVERYHPQLVRFLLTDASIDARMAASSGQRDTLMGLLKGGVDVNAQDNER